MAEVNEIIGTEVGIDFADDETVARQGQCHFIGVAVLHLADGNGRTAVILLHPVDNGPCLFQPRFVINGHVQALAKA